MFLAVTLLLTPVTVHSETSDTLFPIKYTSDTGNYTATKLSHPNDDVMQPDGIVDYENGVADRGQNYSWSAVGYGDYMYVGVLYGAMLQTIQIMAAQNNIDYSIFKAGIDVLYNGTLFMGDEINNPDNEDRSLILKLNTKTGEVSVIVPPNNASYRSAIEYKDKLYFAASSNQPYLLEIDPTTDETKIVYGGAIWDMVEFNNKLYVTVVTGKSGNKQAFAMFCGEENKETGKWSFNLVIGDENDGAKYPYGLGADRSGAANLFVYDNHLYIGGYNDPMIALPSVLNMNFEPIYKDLASPVCLWRMDENESIEMIAGEPNDLFPTVLGNQSAGFGSNLNQYVWRMAEYDNKLYVGTFDIGSLAYPLMQFTNGDVLHMTQEEIESQINYIKILLNLIKEKNDNIPDSVNDVIDNNTDDIIDDVDDAIDITDDIADETIDEVDNDTTITESTDINTKSSDSEEAQYINSLSDESQNAVENSLTELYDGLSELETVLDEEAYSEIETYGLSDSLLNIYQNLVNEYLKIRDLLPEDLVEILDKTLNQDSVDNLFYFLETCKYLSAGERGFDLLVSEDGINFETITTNGFGDPYNHGCRIFAVTNSGLTLGTANPFYGTQVWKITDNQRGTILDSIIKNTDVTYNNNPEASENKTVSFDVDFNGNTLKTIQLDYNTLKEGTDYTVTDNQIILSETLLNSLEVGAYSLSFTFSAGSRANAILNVIDEADSNNSDDNSGTDSGDVIKPTTPTNPNTNPNGSNTNKLPQTGALVSSTVIVFIGLILLCAGALLLKKKSKYNA